MRNGAIDWEFLNQFSSEETKSKLDIKFVDTADEVNLEVLTDQKKITYSTYIYAFDVHGLKALMDFDGSVKSQIAIGIQEDSEFKEVLSYNILKMLQSGVVRNLMQKWVYKKPKDQSRRIFVEDAEQIGVGNLYFPSSVLIVGIAACILLAIAERMKRKWEVKKKYMEQK